MITMVVGNVLSAFIFGTLAAGLKELIDAQNECNTKMNAVEAHMQQCHVPKLMQDEVISYYTTKWKLYGTFWNVFTSIWFYIMLVKKVPKSFDNPLFALQKIHSITCLHRFSGFVHEVSFIM